MPDLPTVVRWMGGQDLPGSALRCFVDGSGLGSVGPTPLGKHQCLLKDAAVAGLRARQGRIPQTQITEADT